MPRRTALWAAVPALLLTGLLLAQPPAKAGRKVAVLVGVGAYKHKFTALGAAPVNDVTELAKVLKAGGYEVVVLTDADATKDAVEAAYKRVLDGQKADSDRVNRLGVGDTLVVHLCGHGLELTPAGAAEAQPYFCGHDALPDTPATMVPLNNLIAAADRQGVRAMFLVDACRDTPDPRNRSRSGIHGTTVQLGEAVSVLYSCGRGQTAQQDAKLGHGLFTYSVLRALRGEADLAGEVAWDDLVGHVKKAFAKDPAILKSLNGVRQTPVSPQGQVEYTPLLTVVARRPVAVPPPGSGEMERAGGAEPKPGEEREFPITDKVKMRFCWVPAGTATLGSPAGEEDRSDDEKERQFTTAGFWLGKYEVTQGEYEAVTGANPSHFASTGGGKDKVAGQDTARFPVEQVSWEDCQGFLTTASKSARGAGVKFRLPHEDEWEFACRGGQGNGRRFQVGDALDALQANFDNELVRTTAVGRFAGSARHPWGLCDMHGNVWEWCENLYSGNGSLRVRRGGGWGNSAGACRSASRDDLGPALRGYALGFRVAAGPAGQ